MTAEQNFSHPVKAATVEIHWIESRGRAEVHKSGCQHSADSKQPFDPATVEADDYFYVAPCARRA